MTSELTAPGPGVTHAPRSPSIAAFLSFLWPGLGQWYAARPRRAIVFAIPVALAGLLLVLQIVGGLETLAVRLFTPAIALAVGLGTVGLCIWRLIAIGDAAMLIGGRGVWHSRPTVATVAVLFTVTVLVHGYIGYASWSLYEAGTQIFVADQEPVATPTPPPSPTASASGIPSTPVPTEDPALARINVLLTGIDSSPRRSTRLTDTLIVASIDPKTGRVALISIPRDIGRFELPNGRVFGRKINELLAYAEHHPKEFPDGAFPTLMGAVGRMLGIEIQYYGEVNLDGFVRMIDLVGGIDVVNQRAINDPSYGGWTDGRRVGFRLSAGKHHLDGQEALAYARSRRGAGDNDFTRARRQQEVLLALRHRILDPAVLPRLPELVQAAGKTIHTNLPPDLLPHMIDLLKGVDETAIDRVVLGPTRYATNPPLSQTGGTYMLVPKLDAIAKKSIELFGPDSTYSVTAQPEPSVSP